MIDRHITNPLWKVNKKDCRELLKHALTGSVYDQSSWRPVAPKSVFKRYWLSRTLR